MITDLFFDLIQVTLGKKNKLRRVPSEKEWMLLYELASKQSLESVLLKGVNRLKNLDANLNIETNLLLEWIGIRLQTESLNKKQNERAKELSELLKKAGFQSCILKGQGTALYYDKPEYRECGDIDIWVSGNTDTTSSTDIIRNKTLQFAANNGFHVGHIDIKHSDIVFFEDVSVEVHYIPSWMYSPFSNKKLQRFFEGKKKRQFANIDEKLGFAHTTIDFDLVYSMVHIYRHIFSEGIGMRQLMDYYYILSHSNEKERKEAFDVLLCLHMKSFVGGIMWIMRECYGMSEAWMLCPANERHGRFLLSEIMTAGNFGQYDPRIKRIDVNKRFMRGFVQLRKNLRFMNYYPSEVLWSPFWKLWHWCWRKKKGYL